MQTMPATGSVSETMNAAGSKTPRPMLSPDDDLLVRCIHCGMCLPTCPTYALTLRERSSPRGRIRLMRAAADGRIPLAGAFAEEMFFCLDCRACETACPAGVRYGTLVESARTAIHSHLPPSLGRRLTAAFLHHIFPFPRRLQLAAWPLRLYRQSGLAIKVLQWKWLASRAPQLYMWLALAPPVRGKSTRRRLPETLPAVGPRRYRVALLTGCVQDLVYPHVNIDTALVLAHNGCEVWIPPDQVCCGSLHGHLGDRRAAQTLARRLMATFTRRSLDAVIVNAAGCGSFMKHYDALFNGTDSAQAREFAERVRDIHEFLMDIGIRTPARSLSIRVTYHDACHLSHGQGIRREPRALLQAIPGLELVPLEESDWCCGSAGVYNLMHPDTAARLLERKLEKIAATGAEIVACGNPGCAIQLEAGIRIRGLPLEVCYPVTLLRRAYGLPEPDTG